MPAQVFSIEPFITFGTDLLHNIPFSMYILIYNCSFISDFNYNDGKLLRTSSPLFHQFIYFSVTGQNIYLIDSKFLTGT